MNPPSPSTVLVVEDSPPMRGFLRNALTAGGYAMVEAADGIEGLNRLQAQEVQAILTDVNVPRMDGLTFFRSVRQDPRFSHIPILVLTAETAPEVKAAGKAAGATGWMVKPFRPEQLRRLLEHVIQRAAGAGEKPEGGTGKQS